MDTEASSIRDVDLLLQLLARKTGVVYSRLYQLSRLEITTNSPFRFFKMYMYDRLHEDNTADFFCNKFI